MNTYAVVYLATDVISDNNATTSLSHSGGIISLALKAYKSTESHPSILTVIGTPPAQFTISLYFFPLPWSIHSEYNL